MTISAYISKILSEYEGIKIETNHVESGSDQYGLYKSPSRNIKSFNDCSYEITEHYQFLARQSAVSSSERNEADEWLEDLCYWVDDYPYLYGLPGIDGNREVTGLSITGSPYVMDSEDREIMYQMSISITYVREREDF